MTPRDGSALVKGELVDVSAGGMRTRAVDPSELSVGTAVDVEIRLPHDATTRRSPGVDLRGTGVVVRMEAAGDDGVDAALRFTTPLELREPFSHLLVY